MTVTLFNDPTLMDSSLAASVPQNLEFEDAVSAYTHYHGDKQSMYYLELQLTGEHLKPPPMFAATYAPYIQIARWRKVNVVLVVHFL